MTSFHLTLCYAFKCFKVCSYAEGSLVSGKHGKTDYRFNATTLNTESEFMLLQLGYLIVLLAQNCNAFNSMFEVLLLTASHTLKNEVLDGLQIKCQYLSSTSVQSKKL